MLIQCYNYKISKLFTKRNHIVSRFQMDGLVSLKIIKHCTEEGTGGDLVQVCGADRTWGNYNYRNVDFVSKGLVKTEEFPAVLTHVQTVSLRVCF